MGVFEPPVAAPTRDFLAIAPGATKKREARTFREWLGAETRRSDAAGKPAANAAPRGERCVRGRRSAATAGCTRVPSTPRRASPRPLKARSWCVLALGKGGAMCVWGVEIDYRIHRIHFCPGPEEQPSGNLRTTGNNNATAFRNFPRGYRTEYAEGAAVRATLRRVARHWVPDRHSKRQNQRDKARHRHGRMEQTSI